MVDAGGGLRERKYFGLKVERHEKQSTAETFDSAPLEVNFIMNCKTQVHSLVFAFVHIQTCRRSEKLRHNMIYITVHFISRLQSKTGDVVSSLYFSAK